MELLRSRIDLAEQNMSKEYVHTEQYNRQINSLEDKLTLMSTTDDHAKLKTQLQQQAGLVAKVTQ